MFLWKLKGILLFPYHMFDWSYWSCSWGYKLNGEPESLRWRLKTAWVMWLCRYGNGETIDLFNRAKGE